METKQTFTRTGTVGVMLVLIGGALLVMQISGEEGIGILAIGLVVLAGYFITRQDAFLLIGALGTGLGAGIVFEDRGIAQGESVVIGLGLGFIAITVIEALVRSPRLAWWPLIPGGILLAAGLADVSPDVRAVAGWAIPVGVIAVGALVLLRGASRTEPRPEQRS